MKKVMDQIPSTDERTTKVITDLLSYIKANGGAIPPDLEKGAAEVLKVVSHPKKAPNKEADRAWEDFKSSFDNTFRFYSHLKDLSPEAKASIIHMMRKAFEAAIDSDILMEAAEADALALFESMGMPETLATYLWSEKSRVRDRDGSGPRGSREHREHVALEILKWAMAPDHKEIKEAIADLMGFTPEVIPSEVMKDMKRGKSVTCPPMMSECFLYPLLGKMDARTVLAHMRALLKALGLTEGEIWRIVDEKKEEAIA